MRWYGRRKCGMVWCGVRTRGMTWRGGRRKMWLWNEKVRNEVVWNTYLIPHLLIPHHIVPHVLIPHHVVPCFLIPMPLHPIPPFIPHPSSCPFHSMPLYFMLLHSKPVILCLLIFPQPIPSYFTHFTALHGIPSFLNPSTPFLTCSFHTP